MKAPPLGLFCLWMPEGRYPLESRFGGCFKKRLEKNGIIVVASFVSPYLDSREFARSQATNFVEVYMKSSVGACENRDDQGHYLKARQGEFSYFPGVDVDYEKRNNPEIVVDIDETTPDQAAEQIVEYLRRHVINDG